VGLKHVEGKRTGRPPGARSKPRVYRDIMWAYRNLDKPDAQPSSAGAKLWLKLAREQPLRFLECALRVDAPTSRTRDCEPEQESEADGTREVQLPARVKTVSCSFRGLLRHLSGEDAFSKAPGVWVNHIPKDSAVVGWKAEREGILLIVRSNDFPVVEQGQAIPELDHALVYRQELGTYGS
jgi:hypothetical protein